MERKKFENESKWNYLKNKLTFDRRGPRKNEEKQQTDVKQPKHPLLILKFI